MGFTRRLKRQNVHPVYGTKFRKGNKGDKLRTLQLILTKDCREVISEKKNKKTRVVTVRYGPRNRCIFAVRKTIQHWKR